MTLLTIVADATAELGQPTLTAVVGNYDPAAMLILRLATNGGKALAKRHAWQALVTEKTFTTVAAAAQNSSIPSDFDRIIPETMYNRTSRRAVFGPISASDWQTIQASLTTMVNPAFRIRGSTILITPTPSAGQSIYYEYVTKNWCQSSVSVGRAAWAGDTDTSLLDEELHTLDLIWRWRATKGLDYAAEQQAFELALADAIMNDGARPRISLGEVNRDKVPYPPQVPDTLVFT